MAWYTRLSDFLLYIGFLTSKVDISLFILSDGTNIFYLLVYVDDILLTGSNSAMLCTLIPCYTAEALQPIYRQTCELQGSPMISYFSGHSGALSPP